MKHVFLNAKITAGEQITFDEAKAEIMSFTKLSAQDIEDLADPTLTQEDRELVIKVYRDAGKAAEPSTWDKIMQVLGLVVQIAGVIAPIAGAVNAVIGVVTAAKNA